jgi:hypothetical protein
MRGFWREKQFQYWSTVQSFRNKLVTLYTRVERRIPNLIPTVSKHVSNYDLNSVVFFCESCPEDPQQWCFRGFTQTLQAYASTVSWNGPRSFPPTSLPSCHFLFRATFNTAVVHKYIKTDRERERERETAVFVLWHHQLISYFIYWQKYILLMGLINSRDTAMHRNCLSNQ